MKAGATIFSMKNHTDMLYKQLFAHPEIVRDLLAGFLPVGWARSLDAGAFERVNVSYVSDRSKQRHGDMVWRVSIGGQWLYVYILLEFQARSDAWMALRMQVYVGLLCQDLVAQHRLTRHGKLPPVLPIVLYHGRGPWRSSTDLSELMLAPPEGLEQFQPQQKYMLLDQFHQPAANGYANVVAILFKLMRAQSEVELRAALELFAERLKAPDMLPARDSLTRWLRSTLQDEFYETTMNLKEEPTMLFNRLFKTFEELFEYEAINRGKAQGLEEGRQEGRQEGQRLALQEVLRSAIAKSDDGMLSEVSEKIAVADTNQLTDWVTAMIGGARPQQVFAAH